MTENQKRQLFFAARNADSFESFDRVVDWNAAGAKPVAWQYKDRYGKWEPVDSLQVDWHRARGFEVRALVVASPAIDAAGASDLETLLADITAIDTWYRGSPSYEHDAGWFKDRVVRLLEERIAQKGDK